MPPSSATQLQSIEKIAQLPHPERDLLLARRSNSRNMPAPRCDTVLSLSASGVVSGTLGIPSGGWST